LLFSLNDMQNTKTNKKNKKNNKPKGLAHAN
jgi:hypothetical protein